MVEEQVRPVREGVGVDRQPDVDDMLRDVLEQVLVEMALRPARDPQPGSNEQDDQRHRETDAIPRPQPRR